MCALRIIYCLSWPLKNDIVNIKAVEISHWFEPPFPTRVVTLNQRNLNFSWKTYSLKTSQSRSIFNNLLFSLHFAFLCLLKISFASMWSGKKLLIEEPLPHTPPADYRCTSRIRTSHWAYMGPDLSQTLVERAIINSLAISWPHNRKIIFSSLYKMKISSLNVAFFAVKMFDRREDISPRSFQV